MSEEKKKQWLRMILVGVLGFLILVADFYPFIDAKFHRSIEVPEWVTTDYVLFFLGAVMFFYYPIKWVLRGVARKIGINPEKEETDAR